MGEDQSGESRPKSVAIVYFVLAAFYLWLGPGFAGSFETSATILGIVYILLGFSPRDSSSTALLVAVAIVGLIGFVAGVIYSVSAGVGVDPVGMILRLLFSLPALIPAFDVARRFGLVKKHT